MAKKQDLVLAAAGGYSWEQMDVWALSLAKSGFTGLGAVIVYEDEKTSEATERATENLKQVGFQVVRMPLRGTVFNQRFYDFWEVMHPLVDELRYAVVTDIRDVYFQTNPMDWLKANLKKSLYACSEGMLYKDESWGRDNVTKGYPLLADRVMNKTIYNVGVLAGEAKAVADMCLAIGMTARSSSFAVADQSGYNILLDMVPYQKAVQFGLSNDGFALQAGTFADPTKIEGFRPNLLEAEPMFDEEGAKTADGKLYPIVHQYDRVPEWNKALRATLNAKLRG